MRYGMLDIENLNQHEIVSDTLALRNTVLTERDADLFLKALKNPQKPNANLKKAFSKYKRAPSPLK
jgi:uncharacterized protein (DUF1778 family)